MSFFNKAVKHIMVFIFLLVMISVPVFAGFDIWLGTGFVTHNYYPDVEEKQYLEAIRTDTDFIEKLMYLGPSLDIHIFPYDVVPVALKIESDILFPIGYNEGYGYRSFNFDFKNRLMVGISYNQSYSAHFGMCLEFGYEYDYNRIATTNIKNMYYEPEYYRFSNHALYGNIALLTTTRQGYFKFGIDYSHSIINSSNSFNWIFKGGICF